jgi:hypothetical protein
MGDKVVVIEEFSASPYKQPFSWKTAKSFKLGDSENKLTSKMPMVLFEDHEGNLFAAMAGCFATKEQYNMLQKHFQKQ